MNEELDYAQMLEIPVNTVNVVKKRSLFPKKSKKETDLKDEVVEKVNEREGERFDPSASFVSAENISEEPLQISESKKGIAGKIILAEAVAACLIAAGIFLTNIFVPDTVINTFMGSLTAVEETEAAYTDFTLTSPVSELSDAEIAVSAAGVITFTDKTAVYPVCDGEISEVTESDGLYTVKIAHTSTFSSVITGLTNVYSSVGEEVASNLPFAYSSGENEVSVSMYDGETLLNCYTLSGAVPVWNA